MNTIILAIGPILILIALGFALGKINFVTDDQFKGLSKLTFVVFIPCLLFLSIYQSDSLTGLSFDLLAAFYLPVITLFFISYLFFRRFFKAQYPKTELLCLATTFSNNVLIGIPILLSLIGEQILLPAFFIVSFHSLLLFTLTTLCAAPDSTQNNSNRRWYRSVATSLWITSRSPIVISLIAGLSLKLLSLELPELLIKPMSYLKYAALPCALMVLGATLARYKVSGQFTLTLLVSSFKLLLLPAMIWFSCHYWFELSATQTAIAVVMSASPVGINVFMFASQDPEASPYLASAILITTSLSMLTIPLWLLILGMV